MTQNENTSINERFIHQDVVETGSVIFTEVELIFEISNTDGSGTQEVHVLANLTCRADSARDAINDLITAIDGVRVRPAEHKLVRKIGAAQASAPAPAPAPAGTPAPAPTRAPAPATGTPAPAPAAAPDAPGGANSPYRMFNAYKMEVLARADKKVDIKFYDNDPNHRFPELTATWSLERAQNLLRPTGDAWDEETLSASGSYGVLYRVWWKESEKLNSHGRPYKDVVKVEQQSAPMPTGVNPHNA